MSKFLTLYVTPVVYLYLDRVDRLLGRRLEPPADLVLEHEPTVPHVIAAE